MKWNLNQWWKNQIKKEEERNCYMSYCFQNTYVTICFDLNEGLMTLCLAYISLDSQVAPALEKNNWLSGNCYNYTLDVHVYDVYDINVHNIFIYLWIIKGKTKCSL